ncbi:MAG: hypothetical protein ACTTKJ_07780 [Prevotella koreensis]
MPAARGLTVPTLWGDKPPGGKCKTGLSGCFVGVRRMENKKKSSSYPYDD